MKQNSSQYTKYLLFGLITFAVGLFIGSNYVNKNKSLPKQAPPQGCFYQEVQCFKAPCDPILICPTDIPDDSIGVGCPEDAKICPDGSTVGRISPSCDFAPCPSDNAPNECVDYLGQPQSPEACLGLPQDARSCNGTDDCVATCSKGCLNREVFTNNMSDCSAIPEYSCECVNQVCSKK